MARATKTTSTLERPRETDEGLKATLRRGALYRAMKHRRLARPYEWYEPHDKGQIQFHQAPHPIRALFPGNGFGKTMAAAAEANAWALHLNEWQKTPAHPVLMLWFAKTADQFSLIAELIRTKVTGTAAKYLKSRGEFVWPDGSRLVLGLASNREDWLKWQGIPVDLVIFDEIPTIGCWREMLQRRRADRKTRFIVAATATQSDTWMKAVVYDPWLKFHKDRGMDETDAMAAQQYRKVWCWPRGGIADNPGADQEDAQWYAENEWSSPEEARVRRFGGFGSWGSGSVFDMQALQLYRDELEKWSIIHGDGRKGSLVPVFPSLETDDLAPVYL